MGSGRNITFAALMALLGSSKPGYDTAAQEALQALKPRDAIVRIEPKTYQLIQISYNTPNIPVAADPPEDYSHLGTMLTCDDDVLDYDLPTNISLQDKPNKDDAENIEKSPKTLDKLLESAERIDAGAISRKRQEDSLAIPSRTTSGTPYATGNGVSVRGIVRGEGYATDDSEKATGRAKAVLDFGDFNLWGQGKVFYLSQDLEDGMTIDGDGSRFEIGADAYFNVFDGGRLLGRAFIGRENRSYTAEDASGNTLDFGNNSTIAGGEVALGEAGLDEDDYKGVTKNANFLRLRAAWRKGDVTGGMDGNHNAFNADAEGHLRLSDSVALHGGASYFSENYGDNLRQRIVAAELGVGYHTDWGFLRGLAIGQLLKSKNEHAVGGALEAGIRVLDIPGTVAVDLSAQAGALHNTDANDTKPFVGLGGTIYLGGKSK